MIEMDYVYDEASQNTTQTMRLQGSNSVLSTLNVHTGPGYQFHDRIECHGWKSAATPAHTYYNTTLTLVKANPGFNSTLQHPGSTPASFSSSDGGKTWTIPRIDLDASTCADPGATG